MLGSAAELMRACALGQMSRNGERLPHSRDPSLQKRAAVILSPPTNLPLPHGAKGATPNRAQLHSSTGKNESLGCLLPRLGSTVYPGTRVDWGPRALAAVLAPWSQRAREVT
jgi:hypothetical protein